MSKRDNKSVNKILFAKKEFQPYFQFWEKQLKTVEAPFHLRQSRLGESRSEVERAQPFERFNTKTFELNSNECDLIKGMVGSNPTGTFVVFTTLFSGLMHAYSGSRHIIFETPLYKPFLKGEVHVDKVPILLNYDRNLPLRVQLGRCQEVIGQSYKLQNFPQAVLHGPVTVPQQFSNVTLYCDAIHRAPAKESDMTVEIKLSDEKIQLAIRTREHCFHPDFVSRMVSHIQKLMTYLKDPTILQCDMVILNQAERATLAEFNSTRVHYPNDVTILDLFERLAQDHGDWVALVLSHHQLTYHQLNEVANGLALQLRETMGIQPCDRVGLMVERGERMIVSILAILKIGAVYLPVDPNYPDARIQHLISDANMRILLTESSLLKQHKHITEHSEDLSFDVGLLDMFWENLQPAAENPRRHLGSDAPAYVIYTSGSTGLPKGVMISHAGVTNMVREQIRIFGITWRDRVLQFASFSFDASVSEIFTALCSGAGLVPVTRALIENPEALLGYMRRSLVTVATLPPAYAAALDLDRLAFLRVLISAGEAVRTDDALNCALFLEYFNAYGPTETSVCATIERVESSTELPVPIGPPIANTQIHVLDDLLRPRSIGSLGDIYIAGQGLALGYLNKPALTASRFLPNPFGNGERMYHTGDLGRWTERGTLIYEGRDDAQVKVNGYRIETGEIEHVLRLFPTLEDAVVFKEDQQLAAYVVGTFDPDELERHICSYLPEFMVPARIFAVPAFPLTTHGKVDAAALRKLAEADREKVGYVEPATLLEQRLAFIWQEVLGKERVGRHDSFFVLGGDSMKAIGLAARINKDMNLEVEVKDLFSYQDVAELARFLETNEGTGDKSRAWELARREVLAVNEQLKQAAEAGRYQLPATFEEAYPISDIQNGMIFHYLLEADFPIYHTQNYVQWRDSNFNLSAYRKAVALIVVNHPILRTSFHLNGFGEPLQFVHTPEALANREIHFEDLRHLDEVGQRARLMQWLRDDRSNGFFIEEPGLWRINIYRLCDDEYGMMLSSHHAILDGWSEALFLKELGTYYPAIRNGEKPRIEVVESHYRDFLIDQSCRKSDTMARDFWKQQLQDFEIPPIPFGKDSASRDEQYEVGYFTRKIPQSLSKDLFSLAQSRGLGIKDLYLAAFMYLMHATTNENDLTVGLVCNARPEVADADRVLGCFLNTVPFRFQLTHGICADALLHRVSRQLRQLKAFDKLSLQEIASLLSERRSHTNLLYDVMFNFAEFHVLADAEQGLAFTEPVIKLKDTATNSAFIFAISKNAEELQVVINYRESLYQHQEMSYLCDLYMALLTEFVNRPAEPLSVTRLLGEQEGRELLVTLNQTEGPFGSEKTIHMLFEEQVARTPDACALTYEDRQYSYEKLNGLANQLAHYLAHTYALEANDLVGLHMERSPSLLTAILAILKSGSAYVPMDPSFPESRLRFMAEDANLKAVICVGDKVPDLGCPHLLVDQLVEVIPGESARNPGSNANAFSTAYVIYTSGTTGQPKGVEVGHRSVVNFLTAMKKAPGIASDDTLLALTTPTFDISVLEMMLPLSQGARVVLAPTEASRDPRLLMDLIAREKPSFIQATPTTWRMLIHAGWEGYKPLKLLVGGEALERNLGEWLLQRCSSLWNMYGPTETTVWSTARRILSPADLGDIGKPILNTRIYFVNPQGELLPRGVPGEICIAGDGLAKGYRNRKELTNSRFTTLAFPRERVFRTGDLGCWLPDGNIRFLGRIDDQVKLNGFRIELGDIEATLTEHKKLSEVVVALKEDTAGNPCLCAYYIADTEVEASELRDFLAEHLPPYMIPNFFMPVACWPLTSSGKTDRKRLPNPEETPVADRVIEAPHTATEEALHELWCDLLKRDAIHIHDSFFTLGGHSLNAVQLLMRIGDIFSIHPPLKLLFSHPSIHTLAAELDHMIAQDHNLNLGATQALIVLNSPEPHARSLFMIPPVLGSSSVFMGLAQKLSSNYLCYGLQCRGLGGQEPFDDSIENMAARFASIIVDVDDNETVSLLGYSMGASVAFEVAVRLEARGRKTNLILLDGSVGGRGANVHSCFDEEVERQIQKWADRLGNPVWLSKMVRHNLTLFDGHRILHKIRGNILALEAEHATEEIISHPNPGMAGWGRQTSGSFCHKYISGGHHDILNEPWLDELVHCLMESDPNS